jgi:hypothetical protein
MKWIKSVALLTLLLSLLTGCMPQRPRMTRAEYLATTTRVYENVDKEAVFSAIEKLFILADGDDFTFTYSENGMQAIRNWSFYLVIAAGFGTDYWNITIRDVEGGVKVSTCASTQSQGVAPAPTTGGNFSAGTTPLMGSPIQGTSIYDLFYARLDYLLGLRGDWMSCDESNQRKSDGITWGLNEALCNSLNMKDDSPTEDL